VTTRFATNNGPMGRLMRRVMDLVALDATQGADTLVWLAESDDGRATSGEYWVTRARRRPSRAARDAATGERLWRASERLAGLDGDALVQAARVAAAR
jgi:hypothetical protein